MRAPASKLAPLPLGVLGLLAACSQGASSDVRVSLSPTIVVPRGLLDNVQRLTVTVYDATGGIDCDATGRPKNVSAATPRVATQDLGTTCQAPAKFCGDLSISSSAAPRVFAAVAYGANNAEIADGCAKIVVNQEKLPLTITMQRNIPPAVCGDGVVQPTEQCEPPGGATDLVCDDQCHTKEERLSVGSGLAQDTTDGNPGDHVNPSFAWPVQSGSAGHFYAVWSDKKPRQQVAARFLTDALGIDTAFPAGAYSSNIADSTSFPTGGQMNAQQSPAVTIVADKYFVAFQDDSTGSLQIHMRSVSIANPTNGYQPKDNPIGINGTNGAGETGVHTQPSIAAGPGGAVYVVWQAGTAVGPGKIVGRTFTAPSTYGPQVELSSGAANQGARVAATSTGWVVVWQSGNDVKLRRVGADGNPSAPEQTVNDGSHSGTQAHPGVATAGDAFAVVWSDQGASGGADVFVQRFKSDGTPIAGDQANRINNVNADGDQTSPAIVGSSAAGGMFVATWVDATSTHVQARLLGAAGGFLFNNVDGQTNEFQVSLVDGHARANPAVAIGGAGPFIALGWEDLDPSKPGIYARRFPVPTQ